MGIRRGGIRVAAVLMGLLLGLSIAVLLNEAARATDSNQVSFWCDEGVKIEPINSPSYTVPAPPEGYTWTLLVIKSATDNETFPNPVPGQTYAPSNGHDVSHVILCMESQQATTTSSSTTTSSTTTSSTTTSSTTTSSTTTLPTDPSTTTTTSSTTSTTSPIDPSTTTTTAGPLVDTTTTTQPPPVGGVSAGGGAMASSGLAAAVPWLIGGAVALLTSLALLAHIEMADRRRVG